MQIKDWITEILERHNIRFPDQRPLYQYRITDTEFESLKSAIKLSILLGLSTASKNVPRWNAAFVMYAAEWWRREYDGTRPTWDKVFESVGAKSQNLSTGQRNVLVESGLQFWRRSIRVINGRHYYLGSIACEGGLPLNQLNNSSGWLGRVFKQVIPKYSRLRNTGIQAYQLINECEYIPITYRENKEIHLILGDMVKTVVELKHEFQLHERSNPVAFLDQHCLSWRERFPLPIETEVGGKLLSDMVSTAAKSDDVTAIPMRAIRQLKDNGCLQLQIEFLGFIALEELAISETAPARLEVELASSDGKTRMLGVALKTVYKQKPALKMPRMPETIKGERALQSYAIRFKYLSETLKEIPLIGGAELDNNAPWVFVQQDSEWVLEGVASINTRAKRVRILFPEHFNYQANAEVQNLETVFFGKKLIEADGCIRFTDAEANTFTIKTAQPHSPSSYELQGKQSKFASTPKELFLGLPTLRRIDHETGASTEIPAKDLVARPVNSQTNWQRLTPELQGVYEIRLLNQGNILFRKKCAILSEQFAVRFKPSANSLDGTIYLDYAKPAIVVCESTVKHTITPENDGYRIDLIAELTPPPYVCLALYWPGMTDMLSLLIPFPARGGQVIDANGNLLSSQQALFSDQLHGFRLRLFSGYLDRKRELQIEFKLKDDRLDDIKDVYFRHEIQREGNVVELAIIDYLEWIRTLMAISSNLDSYVQLAVYENGSELLRRKIKRYQFSLGRNLEQGTVELNASDQACLSCDIQEGITLMAMRLSQPEQEHIRLESQFTEQVLTGSWFFSPEKRVAEPWLIYSAKTSSVSLRPILWGVECDSENSNFIDTEEVFTLHSAVKIGHIQTRHTTIKNILARMSADFGHSGWDYLRHLWRYCQHLPMSSFDVWTTAVTDTRILAALALQMDEAFIESFSEELPVFWELVPLRDWLAVHTAYKNYLLQAMDEADANEILEKRIDKIGLSLPPLNVLAKILKKSICGIVDQQINLMILSLESSADMNGLRKELERRQANSDWPTMFKSELVNEWIQLEEFQQFGLKILDIPKHHHAVVILPVLLAVFCTQGNTPKHWLGNATPIFKLNRLKAFDEDWFNSIFEWALVYFSQKCQQKTELLNTV
ncbi:STY4851/ECs_5259 family protein [Methylobacter sp. BlB1]|uniref:STY4851/ECs_5259 family protein n=1 Tax=unclassified Methylobacter TaxID=2635283 RepID=UPI0018939FFD|nr:STY4851/ECs_5259 family protein [Methylobacter sp. BlB1]MBF6650086.1 hypothetical protein [Methylobacter sp. BlB1]